MATPEKQAKVDYVPILEGPQGALKTTLLTILAFDRDDWVTDGLPADLHQKDARSHLAGKLIVELSELKQLRVNKADTLKSFLSATNDKYRPAYARREIMQLRQCVFVGTTNDPDYLVDITGNRRFWPVRCGEINLALARDLRPQLYAEALHRWRSGEQWWPQPVEERMAEEVQRSRLAADPWDKAGSQALDEAINLARASDEIEAWVTTGDVMAKAGIELQHQDMAKMLRAARVLVKLGGKHGQLPRGEGWPKRGYRFYLRQKPYPC